MSRHRFQSPAAWFTLAALAAKLTMPQLAFWLAAAGVVLLLVSVPPKRAGFLVALALVLTLPFWLTDFIPLSLAPLGRLWVIVGWIFSGALGLTWLMLRPEVGAVLPDDTAPTAGS